MAIKYLDAKRVRGSSTADATPDYTSDFTSVGSDGNGVGWTGSDTSKFYVDASEDKYFFDTLADHKSSYFDLDNATNAPNVGTLTTSYVVRWKMKFAAVDTGGTYWEIGLSDGTGERNANQHFNGIHMREDHFRISVTKDNQAPDGASGTYLSAVSPTETFNTTDTIYFELIRDGVDFTLNRYTADDYSTGKTTPCTLTINNSTWVGAPAAIMRYFRIITNNTEQFTGHVWDVKFYNDVTSTTQDEKATLVTTAATKNAGWTQNVATGSMPQVVDGTGIDLDTAGASGTNKVRHLIGSTLSNTAWVMRFKLNHKDSGGAESPLLCLCANNTTGNDFYDDALMVFANSTGSNPAELRATYYTSGGGSNGQSTGITLVDATTYYVELIRTAANTLTISVFTGSDYSTGQVSSTQTVTSSNITGIDDLISIQTGLGTTNGARDIDVVIQEIKIYNGVTSATGTPVYETNFSTSSDLPENTLFEETDTYNTYWLQSAEWKNTYVAASILSLGGSTDGDLLVSYSAASGWGSALATYPFSGGMFACAGNAVNAQFAQGHYTNGQSYKYYGSSNTYSADVGSGLYLSSNGGSGGEQDNMIVFGGNKGGGGTTHIVNSEKCSKYTGASTWTTCGVLSKKYREVGGGSGTPTSAICVCGEAGGSSSFPDYDSVENYSGASDAWSTNSTAFPINFNNGIYFGTATEGVGGMGDSQAAGAPRSETYYTTNSGDTWSSSQNNTYDGYGVGCAGTSSDAGLAWCGNNWATSTSYSTTNDYSKASGWSNSGNSYAHTSYNIRGTGNASG